MVATVRLVRLGLAVFALTVALPALAEPTFPPLSGRVVDQANLIDATVEAGITADLAALEERTTAQVVVVTLSSLEGYDIADYGVRLGRHWQIGQAGENNGALLIVAPTERTVRIEVGYGLEGVLPDALAHLIIQNAVLPHFRAGDFEAGIRAGVTEMIAAVDGEGEAVSERLAPQGFTSDGDLEDTLVAVIVFLFIALWLGLFIWAIIDARRNPEKRRHRQDGRRASSWSWGGGSSGGGGFSGGGGSFGGGGASGSW